MAGDDRRRRRRDADDGLLWLLLWRGTGVTGGGGDRVAARWQSGPSAEREESARHRHRHDHRRTQEGAARDRHARRRHGEAVAKAEAGAAAVEVAEERHAHRRHAEAEAAAVEAEEERHAHHHRAALESVEPDGGRRGPTDDHHDHGQEVAASSEAAMAALMEEGRAPAGHGRRRDVAVAPDGARSAGGSRGPRVHHDPSEARPTGRPGPARGDARARRNGRDGANAPQGVKDGERDRAERHSRSQADPPAAAQREPRAQGTDAAHAIRASRAAEHPLQASDGRGSAERDPVRIVRRDGDTVVQVDLPGADPADLDVVVMADAITVRGLIAEVSAPQGTEERLVPAAHHIVLPEAVVPDMARARYREGLLEVAVPNVARETVAGRRIPVEAG